MSIGQTQSQNTLPLAAIRSDHECFACGGNNPIGLHLRFAARDTGVTAAFVPQHEHQGFQGVIHGGIISTVLDEAMAWAAAYSGLWAVTGEMRVRYRVPLLVGEDTTVTAQVTGIRGQTIATTAVLLRDTDGTTIATATATFVKVAEDTAAAWQARYLVDDQADGD